MLDCIFLELSRQWNKLTNISSRRSTNNPNAFLVIYENEKAAFEYPEMENQTNVEYKISFMGFLGKCDKYDKRYFSHIRTNENYWLSVDVTKSSPFKKIRTLPRKGLIPSIVVYICLLATTFEIISSKKINKKKENSKERERYRCLVKPQN